MPDQDLRFQYQQIARELRNQILRGELRIGEKLLSERVLVRHYQVHRNTIRQALAALEGEGHISTEGRRGSFVLSPGRAAAGGAFLVNIVHGSGPNGTALYDGVASVVERIGVRIKRTSTEPLAGSSMNRVPDAANLAPDTLGVLLWPHHPSDPEQIKRLNDAVPVVLVDHRVIGLPMDCVRFDDVTGGRLVTEHLLNRGHRRIAFLTDEVFADSVQSRWHGYMLAHESAGIPCDSRLSLLYQEMDPGIVGMNMRRLLADSRTRPTAVVCSNDLVAFALLRFLNAEGLRVPDDMAVSGYGNAMPEYANAISLTTVDQPFFTVGVEAAKLLSHRVRQTTHDRLRAPTEICLPVNLVIRGST